MIDSGAGFKSSNGYVSRVISTELEPEQVETYYRQLLEERDWYFMKKENRVSKNRIIFCFNGDTAILEVPESGTERGYTYSLMISWGIDYGCPNA
jgi:hypothetical protein